MVGEYFCKSTSVQSSLGQVLDTKEEAAAAYQEAATAYFGEFRREAT